MSAAGMAFIWLFCTQSATQASTRCGVPVGAAVATGGGGDSEVTAVVGAGLGAGAGAGAGAGGGGGGAGVAGVVGTGPVALPPARGSEGQPASTTVVTSQTARRIIATP